MTDYVSVQIIANTIKTVPNFPKDGINFRDIGKLLMNMKLFKKAIKMICKQVKKFGRIDCVAGIESRGFHIGMAIAMELDVGFVSIRKPNKLPGECVKAEYGKEYGTDVLTLQVGLIPENSRVLIVDDLLATGGSLVGAAQLIGMLKNNSEVAGFVTLIELTGITHHPDLNKYNRFGLMKLPAGNTSNTIDTKDELSFMLQKRFLPFTQNKNDDRIIVFSHDTTYDFARLLISRTPHMRHGTIEWKRFPDTMPDVTFEDLEYLKNKHVVFIMSLNELDPFLEQMCVLKVLSKKSVKSFHLVIPYFAPATMERAEREGVLATAEPLFKMLSDMHITQTGKPNIYIYDIHAPIERFYPDENKVNVVLLSAIPLLKQRLSELYPNGVSITFPDEGAKKRFDDSFNRNPKQGEDFEEHYPIAVFNKTRIGNKRELKLAQCPKDKNSSVIVDDLAQSGVTLIACMDAMIENQFNPNEISASVVHAVFPNNAYEKFLVSNIKRKDPNAKCFKKFFVTNTNYNVTKKLEGNEPFEIIDITPNLASELLRRCYHDKEYTIQDQKTYSIYVTSHNDTKLAGAYYGIERYLNDKFGKCHIEVYGVDVPSGVNNQPLHSETEIGCINRLNHMENWLKVQNINCDYIVSVENGITWDDITKPMNDIDNFPYDFCTICVKNCQTSQAVVKRSDEIVSVDTKFVEMSLASKLTKTVGELIEEAFEYKKGSWHKFYQCTNSVNRKTLGKSRMKIIIDGVHNVASNNL